MKAVDITGKKFGRLTAISFTYKNKFCAHYWEFKCKCGKIKILRKTDVIFGRINSCGCLKKELDKVRTKTHGMTHTRFYMIYAGIKDRCLRENNHAYNNYGGRGIKICDRWLKFENFKEDMYQSYLEHVKKYGEVKTEIDRIDNNGNYELNNCKWSTLIEQANNTRQNRYVTYKGETLNISRWAEKLNIKYEVLYRRLNKNNWSLEKII